MSSILWVFHRIWVKSTYGFILFISPLNMLSACTEVIFWIYFLTFPPFSLRFTIASETPSMWWMPSKFPAGRPESKLPPIIFAAFRQEMILLPLLLPYNFACSHNINNLKLEKISEIKILCKSWWYLFPLDIFPKVSRMRVWSLGNEKYM